MLKVENVSVMLDKNKIVDNVSISLHKGEVVGLVGPNGVGKTTLIKTIVGIYEVETGNVTLDGQPVYNNPTSKLKISYVSDENGYYHNFTINDIMKYYKYAYDNFDIDKFNKLNEVFKIPTSKKIGQLSKGMKMRVSLLMAFSIDSEYIVLDEPTSGLDPLLKRNLLQIIKEEAKNKGIIISSHHLGDLEKICTEVIIISDGRVKCHNSLQEIQNKIKKIQVAFDEPVYEEDLNFKGIYSISKVGRVFTIITDQYCPQFIDKLNELKPLFIEEIELSLEDYYISRVGENDEEVI